MPDMSYTVIDFETPPTELSPPDLERYLRPQKFLYTPTVKGSSDRLLRKTLLSGVISSTPDRCLTMRTIVPGHFQTINTTELQTLLSTLSEAIDFQEVNRTIIWFLFVYKKLSSKRQRRKNNSQLQRICNYMQSYYRYLLYRRR